MLRPYLDVSHQPGPHSQDRFRGPSKLGFVLVRKRSLAEANLESHASGDRPELDDSRRRPIDHLDDRS